jgi:hypothetical protein
MALTLASVKTLEAPPMGLKFTWLLLRRGPEASAFSSPSACLGALVLQISCGREHGSGTHLSLDSTIGAEKLATTATAILIVVASLVN